MLISTIRVCRSLVWFGGLALGGVLFADPAPLLITVQPDRRHQTIEGFGASIAAFVESMQPVFRDPVMASFAANELGLSVFRLQIRGDLLPEEIADWRDISADDFNWTFGDGRSGINVEWARLIRQANAEVRIIGSVWSAPGWMKFSGKVDGTAAGYLLDPNRNVDHDNRLRPDRFEHFAKWVVEYARYMEEQGSPFYALSLQNELLFTEPYGSTMYNADEYARLVRVTGEMFAREGVRKPLFFGPEDMTLATYADTERHRPFVDALMSPDTARYFDAFASHGSSDGIHEDLRQDVTKYWQGISGFGRPYWITEGETGGHEWPEPITGGIASRLHVALTQANVSLFTGWQLTGNEKHPSHSIMIDGEPTPKSYAAMQFWRHVRPGAERVEVLDPGSDDLLVSAYVHDQRRELVSVLINRGEQAREVVLNWGRNAHPTAWRAWQTSADANHESIEIPSVQQMVRLSMPGHSITTAVADWDPEWVTPHRDPRWTREIRNIVAQEAAYPVPENGILFVGSSSIRLWESLQDDFPGQPVYRRGFGGSQISDLIGYFDEVILAGSPRLIVIYSGTNDLNSGESEEHVLADIDRLCGMIKERLPDTRIAFISAAPNPRRWPVSAAYQRFNAMTAHYCERTGHTYINVWDSMLGTDGLPSRDLYRDDQLHMNANGYAVWREIITPLLP